MNYLPLICLLGSLVLSSCAGESSSVISQSNSNSELETIRGCNELKINNIPTGDELKVRVERVSKAAILIEVRNKSDHRVFLPFEGDENGDAGFVGYVAEHRDKSGRFVTDSEGGDYAPGLKAIDPGGKIRFKIYENRRGLYRLRFRYLVDENAARLINDPRCSSKLSDETYKFISKANAQTYSPTIEIK